MAKLPISKFLTQRLKEYDSTFELRQGTGFESLFFKPLEFIVQPLRDEADQIQIAQSFRRILLTGNPDTFSEEAVDALAHNLFVFRNTGSKSGGVARVYYNNAVDREWPTGGATFTGSNGALYSNPAPFAITRGTMGAQIETGLFFYDIPVVSKSAGSFDLATGGLVSLAGDSEAISVTNKLPLTGGLVKETNTQLITRTQNSIAVRDLVTGKGFSAVLLQNFPASIVELQPIGMGDPEMMRDIIFNTHAGRQVDGYVKTPAIQTGTLDVVGLLIDTTRQAHASANVQLVGTLPSYLGNPNLDHTGGLTAKVSQVKPNRAAAFISTVDLTGPVDLSGTPYISIGIDGVYKDIYLPGALPSATTRSEIISAVNAAFGLAVLSVFGVGLQLRSLVPGLASQVVIRPPALGTSASMQIFGLNTTGTFVYQGDGPRTFNAGIDYILAEPAGMLARLIGGNQVPQQVLTGQTSALSAVFTDATLGVFTNAAVGDVVTIETGADAGDYRIVTKTSVQSLVLDAPLTASASVSYHINRTAIKDGERVYVDYYYNPLSVDIGPLVLLDPDTRTRGVRPGRDAFTIKDVAFLRTLSVELIDPLTKEGLGTFLKGGGGYGVGGYGAGPYGVGSGPDYRIVVNSPTERFSAFEDSFITINSAFQGYSLRVTYEYVPEVLTFHNFVRSPAERVLDGDLLMKHFLPAYVSGEIQYTVDKTNSSIPDNATMTTLLREFINLRKAGSRLVFSTLEQFMTRVTDPFDRFGTRVNSFQLTAKVHNTDGSTTVLSGVDALEVPTPVPFPKFTTKPISPRIVHWIADNIILTRL